MYVSNGFVSVMVHTESEQVTLVMSWEKAHVHNFLYSRSQLCYYVDWLHRPLPAVHSSLTDSKVTHDEGDLRAILYLVASTILKWKTFKFLRWMEYFHYSSLLSNGL
jgi:hypothetical protein